MGDVRDNLRRNIGYFLSLANLSQKDFAEKLNVSQSAVTNWIKGKNSPDIELIAQMCDIFEVSIHELMGIKKSAPALSTEAMEVAEAYDRADDETKRFARRALGILRPPHIPDIEAQKREAETLAQLHTQQTPAKK